MQSRRYKCHFYEVMRFVADRLMPNKKLLFAALKSRQNVGYFFALLIFLYCSNSFAVAIEGELAPPERMVILPFPCDTPVGPKRLTLREAIFLALRTNPNVRIAGLQRISDKFALEVAHNLYVPQYTLTANATFQPGSKPQYTISPGATLLTPLGTKLGLAYSGSFLGSAGNGSSIVGTVTQPLLQGFGPQVTMAPLVQAEYQEHVNRLNLKNTIITTVTQVIQNYYALVQAYNSLVVDELALKNSLAMVEQYRIRIKAGQAAPLELAPQQTQVASQRLQVTQDKNAIQQAYQALLTTLGLDPRSKLVIDKTIYIDTLRVPSEQQSTDLALENNIEYLQGVYQLKQDEIALLLAKDANRWILNLVATKTIEPNTGSGAITTVGGTTIGGTTIGGTTTGGDSVQLNLTVPINNKQLEAGVVNAKVILQQQKITLSETKRALRANIINSIQTLKFQQQQIKQAQAAVTFAQQAYEVELIKLRYGRSTVLNVTQLQTSLTQSKQSLIAQQISYINSLAAFEALLGISLDKWDIQIYY